MKNSIPFQLISIKPKEGGPLLISGHDQGYVAAFDLNIKMVFAKKEQESRISSLVALSDQRRILSAS